MCATPSNLHSLFSSPCLVFFPSRQGFINIWLPGAALNSLCKPRKALSCQLACLSLLSSWYHRPVPTLAWENAIWSVWNVVAQLPLSSVMSTKSMRQSVSGLLCMCCPPLLPGCLRVNYFISVALGFIACKGGFKFGEETAKSA